MGGRSPGCKAGPDERSSTIIDTTMSRRGLLRLGAAAGAAAAVGPLLSLGGLAPDARAGAMPVASPEGIYPGRPSVLPGSQVKLCASTRAGSYQIRVRRIGGGVDERFRHLPGRNHAARLTTPGGVATPNWPAAVTLDTTGYPPGVYDLSMIDSADGEAHNVLVVRTPHPSPDRPLAAFPLLTWAAYNPWGGGSFYTDKPRATTVLLARPNDRAAGELARGDEALSAWLDGEGVDWTTDLDLSLAPPAATPRALVMLRHGEYVTKAYRDWLDQRVVGAGDMGLVSLGSNPIFWRVRATPWAVTCHKPWGSDPVKDPAQMTGRFRDAAGHPEGQLLGAQYVSVVDGDVDMVVQPGAPAWLLDGTGLAPGDVLPGLLGGEADALYGSVGSSALAADYQAPDSVEKGVLVPGAWHRASTTFTQHPSGGRAFDAGTFRWGLHLGDPAVAAMTRNALAWAGRS